MITLNARLRAAAAVLLCIAAVATAHEHHDDKIEEGEGISQDPIVRRKGQLGAAAFADMDARTRYYGSTS